MNVGDTEQSLGDDQRLHIFTQPDREAIVRRTGLC